MLGVYYSTRRSPTRDKLSMIIDKNTDALKDQDIVPGLISPAFMLLAVPVRRPISPAFMLLAVPVRRPISPAFMLLAVPVRRLISPAFMLLAVPACSTCLQYLFAGLSPQLLCCLRYLLAVPACSTCSQAYLPSFYVACSTVLYN